MAVIPNRTGAKVSDPRPNNIRKPVVHREICIATGEDVSTIPTSPTLSTGSTAPTHTRPAGSLYLRTNGVMYITSGGGTWASTSAGVVVSETADGAIGARAMVAIDASGDHVEGSIALGLAAVGINSENTILAGTDPLLLGVVGPATGIAACPIKAGRNLKLADSGYLCQLVDAATSGNTIDDSVGTAFTNQPANDGVTLVSDNAGDTTQTVTIIGTTQGTDTVVTEDVVLTGVVDADSVKVDWGFILAIKMDSAATGTVELSETSGGLAITTLAPAALTSGVVSVPAADQGAHNVAPTIVGDAGTTKTVGIQYTQNDGSTVAYQADALNGTTAVTLATPALLVTELYVGDLEAARTVTVAVGAADDELLKVGKATGDAAARLDTVALQLSI